MYETIFKKYKSLLAHGLEISGTITLFMHMKYSSRFDSLFKISLPKRNHLLDQVLEYEFNILYVNSSYC